jgi:transposase
MHAYLLRIKDELLPKSEAGQAVAYILKNWAALTRYVEDGDLAIDINRTERSPVDPFAWFRDVLTRIPNHSIQQLDVLLPHRWAEART